MKRFVAVAMIVAGLVLPACAQRGGSRGGFSAGRGGSAFHGTPSRGGFPPPSSPRFSASHGFTGARSRNPAPGFRGLAPDHSRAGWNRLGRDRHRRPYISVYGTGLPYLAAPWPGWIGPDDLGYPDDSGYSDAQPTPDASSYGAPGPYAYGDAPGGSESYGAPPPDRYQPAPQPYPRPAYQPPNQPAQAPLSQDAVTLVFRDGRPDEQIHNYILTRNALYVQDENRRTIPLDQLDLAATAKVNRQAGADFQIPNPPK